jgi:hypothetical protein
MKQCYWTNLLRSLADEDGNMIGVWKKNYCVECYIWCMSGMVFYESSNAGSVEGETSSRSG